MFTERDIKYYYRIQHIPISLDAKVHFKQTNLNFLTKFTQKGYFQSKAGENKSHHQIKHIQFNLSTKFHLKQKGSFQCLEQICPKGLFDLKQKK